MGTHRLIRGDSNPNRCYSAESKTVSEAGKTGEDATRMAEMMQASRSCYPEPVIEPLPLVPRMIIVAVLAGTCWAFPITAGLALLR
jgi:hypothetical protein